MERPTTAASYALPLFALLWLGTTLAADFLPSGYAVDTSETWGAPSVVLTRVAPEAAKAGLRVGDIVADDRAFFLRKFGMAGTTAAIRVHRKSQTLTLSVPRTQPLPRATPPVTALNAVCIAFALLLAAYLGFRKPSVMIAALILFLGGGDLNWPQFIAHFGALPDALYFPFGLVTGLLCQWFPVMALASFAIRLPGGPLTESQRKATGIVDAIVIATFCCGLLLPFGLLMRSESAFAALSAIVLTFASLGALMFVRQADRGRTGIVFAGLMIGGVVYAVNNVMAQSEPGWLYLSYGDIAVVVVPLALAYAILRHRVFDVAFVLNRTVVFALTSALVLVVFAALEFMVERFLSGATHVEGVVLQFGIALAVIVTIRLLHRRVDLVVANVLFRSRHEQESALRRFASTLQFYTEDSPLVRDTLDVLLRYARVQGAAVYLAQDAGLQQVQSSFPVAISQIDHNDMAYVELRAHHEPLLVHTMPTAFPGDRLYPMTRAGRIVGVVATGERESSEEMPPDIDDAIKQIAHAAATALGAIESDRIRLELTTLRARLGFS